MTVRGVLCALLLLLPFAAWSQTRETVHLRFRCWDGDEAQKALRPAIADFEKKYPWIKVTFESVTQSYIEKLLLEYAGGKAPDVAMMDPSQFQRFAKRKAILPLNQFYDDIPGFDINTYYKNLVDAHSYKGTLYVLPRDIAPIGIIYYNKSLFDKAGIPYPDGTWTWDYNVREELRHKDFFWVLRELTGENEKGEKVWGYAPGWPDLLTLQFAFSRGWRVMDDYEEPTKLLYDDPRILDGFKLVTDLTLNKRWVPSNEVISTQMQTGALQLFTQQRVAMYQSGIWDVPNLRRDLKPGNPGFFEWDIALAPAYKDGTLITPTGGSGYAIMSSTKHPKEAWLLTAWMAGPPGMLAMAKAGLAQPGIVEMAKSAPWIPDDSVPVEERYPASRIVTHIAAGHVQFSPTSEFYPEVNGYVTAEWGRVWSGDVKPEVALAKGNSLAQARLDVLRREAKLPPFNWPLGWGLGIALTLVLVAWVYWPERKIKYTSAQKKESRIGYLFLMPWILGTLIFTVGPMLLSLLMSFADWDIIREARFRGFGNFHEMFTSDIRVFASLIVTAVYTVVAVPLGIAISLAMALLLNVKVRGMPLFRTCFYLPSLASGVAASLIWMRIFKPEGGLLNAMLYSPVGEFFGIPAMLKLLNPHQDYISWLGNENTALTALIIMSLWGAGGGMVILLAGLQGIPTHYYEAATIDGASGWRRFKTITVPMLSPTLFFCLITGVIGSFQSFTSAFIMTGGGPGDSTRFFMLHLYNQAFIGIRMGYASALAWVLFVIILVVTLAKLAAAKKFVYYEAEAK